MSSPSQPSLPLSPPQLALWLSHMIAPDSVAYNVAVTLRFGQLLTPEQAQVRLVNVVKANPILTTTYHLRGSHPVQVTHPDLLPELRVSQSESDAETAALIAEHAVGAFDLAAGPPVRFLLVQQSDDYCLLSVAAHHIVMDGPSRLILASQLASDPSDPGPASPRAQIKAGLRPKSYEDFVLASASPQAKQAAEAGLAYWRQQLAGSIPLRLWPESEDRADSAPRRHEHEGGPSDGQPQRVAFTLGEDDTAALEAIALRSRASLYALLSSTVALALARCAGTDDILFGSVFSGRRDPRFADTVGHFVNLVPLRCLIRPAESPTQLMARMQRTVAEAARHQSTPFSEIVRAAAAPPTNTGNPLFEAIYVHEQRDTGWPRLPAEVELLDDDRPPSRYLVAVATQIVDDRLRVVINYGGRIRRRHAREFASELSDAIGYVATASNRPLNPYLARPTGG